LREDAAFASSRFAPTEVPEGVDPPVGELRAR
jgi:hypothetical protein